MATVAEEPVMPAEVIESLELLMFEAVGMTAIAVALATTGELTLPQWRALVVVGRVDAVRVGDIAAAVGMSLPSTSRLIQRLERRGLVATARDESDRRATLVRLTDGGRDLRRRVVTQRRAMMEDALATHAPRLPKDLTAGLTAIAEAFNRYR